MTTRPRRSLLRKIAARRQRSRNWDARPGWALFLAGALAKTAHRTSMSLVPGQRVLTKRELEVLRLVATGETDRGIADMLYLSRRTVSSHVSNILAKLDVPSRRAAVIAAARIGLL
jgi:DNA-binding NarL/FixJ family response regulator